MDEEEILSCCSSALVSFCNILYYSSTQVILRHNWIKQKTLTLIKSLGLKSYFCKFVLIALLEFTLLETPLSLCLLLREDDKTASYHFFLVCSGFLSQLRLWSALNRVEHAKKLRLLKNKGLTCKWFQNKKFSSKYRLFWNKT